MMYTFMQEFLSFQCSLSLIKLLLRYHDPELAMCLESKEMTPELYSTSPLLTMFSQKTELPILYSLWDYIITEGDILYFSYFYVALIILCRESILYESAANIPELLCNMKIKNKQHLDSIIGTANQLRKNSPASFALWVKKLGFLNKKSTKEIFKNSLSFLEKAHCIQVVPEELIYLMYSNYRCSCQSPFAFQSQQPKQKYITRAQTSKNVSSYSPIKYTKEIAESAHEEAKFDICFCKEMKIYYHSYKAGKPLIIDIRAKEQQEMGFFPNTLQYPIVTADSIKGLISLINENGEHKTGERIYLLSSEEGDEKRAQIESECIKSILANKTCHLSCIYGGYRDVHNMLLDLKLTIINHDPLSCKLCLKLVTKKGVGQVFKSFFGISEKASKIGVSNEDVFGIFSENENDTVEGDDIKSIKSNPPSSTKVMNGFKEDSKNYSDYPLSKKINKVVMTPLAPKSFATILKIPMSNPEQYYYSNGITGPFSIYYVSQ